MRARRSPNRNPQTMTMMTMSMMMTDDDMARLALRLLTPVRLDVALDGRDDDDDRRVDVSSVSIVTRQAGTLSVTRYPSIIASI